MMQNFEYCVPTKVIFGKDTELCVAGEIAACGGSRVLIVYGGKSAERSGLLGRIRQFMDRQGLFHAALGGVKPNPRLSKVREGVEIAKKENVDFLLAVGGGSVIDTVKAIGYAVANPEHDIWDLFSGKRCQRRAHLWGWS